LGGPRGQECSCDPAALGQQPPDTAFAEEHLHLHLESSTFAPKDIAGRQWTVSPEPS
ncbi:hypothetical protein LEMLEM_LOCUS20022, partial [Lemmus lemmus]